MVKRMLKRVPGARRLARLVGLTHQQSHRREFLLKMLAHDIICAEIGVHEGAFAAHILETVRPRELHLIDPWKHEDSDVYEQAVYGGKTQGGQEAMDARYRAVCQRFATDIESGRVTVHRGYSGDVLPEFPDEYFDWVYIDANHLYEHVLQDLELAFVKTKPGGYIAGDDYKEGGWMQGGVKQAVAQFIKDRPVSLVLAKSSQFVLHKTV